VRATTTTRSTPATTSCRWLARRHRPHAPPADEDVDLDDLVDAPPESVVSPLDRLTQAFPGSQLVDE
jgi:hypothetical protein